MIDSRDTEPIDGKASPRNPRVSISKQVFVGELRGGMALDRKIELFRAHARAVIRDLDQAAGAAVGE